MSRNHRPNYVVVHYSTRPNKSNFTETYGNAREALGAMRMMEATDDTVAGYSEITCTATGKKGVRQWNRKKIQWTKVVKLATGPISDHKFKTGETHLAIPLFDEMPTGSGKIGMILPVASQAAEHGLSAEVE
jgi:hypothetical protein